MSKLIRPNPKNERGIEKNRVTPVFFTKPRLRLLHFFDDFAITRRNHRNHFC